MNLIVCLDNNNGMMFNNKRQSQDKILRADIKRTISNNKLLMNEYSYKLYKDIDDGNIIVTEDFLDICKDDDFCLVENKALINYINKVNNLIIYKWNRNYPADLYLDIDLNNKLWELINIEEFADSSHDKITKEIYRRIN